MLPWTLECKELTYGSTWRDKHVKIDIFDQQRPIMAFATKLRTVKSVIELCKRKYTH